jgi:hypothetical protein
MRLWTVHPRYLDAKGLVAAWRESLLAQKVLLGRTSGYRHHPQLERFRASADPVASIGAYLTALHEEASARGYRFDAGRIEKPGACAPLPETEGQLRFEWKHLRRKLQGRAPERFGAIRPIALPDPHPLFTIVPGPRRSWERSGPA